MDPLTCGSTWKRREGKAEEQDYIWLFTKGHLAKMFPQGVLGVQNLPLLGKLVTLMNLEINFSQQVAKDPRVTPFQASTP